MLPATLAITTAAAKVSFAFVLPTLTVTLPPFAFVIVSVSTTWYAVINDPAGRLIFCDSESFKVKTSVLTAISLRHLFLFLGLNLLRLILLLLA